eukprot:GHVN01038767.1.p2 GENE.GHVN01038767.1~~GHVN01038767.1.p2  ORF type:complete len:116 (-),score=13.26 GHVN01038767.1:98-445(-)
MSFTPLKSALQQGQGFRPLCGTNLLKWSEQIKWPQGVSPVVRFGELQTQHSILRGWVCLNLTASISNPSIQSGSVAGEGEDRQLTEESLRPPLGLSVLLGSLLRWRLSQAGLALM